MTQQKKCLALAAPAMVLLFLIFIGIHPLDLAIENRFYNPESGFYLKHNWWLEEFLHIYAKQVVIVIGVAVLLLWLGSFFISFIKPSRRQLTYLALSLLLCTAIATPLKNLTGMHCPWSLKDFGGEYDFINLLENNPVTQPRGKC